MARKRNVDRFVDELIAEAGGQIVGDDLIRRQDSLADAVATALAMRIPDSMVRAAAADVSGGDKALKEGGSLDRRQAKARELLDEIDETQRDVRSEGDTLLLDTTAKALSFTALGRVGGAAARAAFHARPIVTSIAASGAVGSLMNRFGIDAVPDEDVEGVGVDPALVRAGSEATGLSEEVLTAALGSLSAEDRAEFQQWAQSIQEGQQGTDANDPIVLTAHPEQVGSPEAVRTAGIASQATTSTVGTELARVLNMSNPEMTDLMTRLWAGGFYDGNIDLDDLNFSNPHAGDTLDATVKAYERALTRAAGYHQAGRFLTVDQTIDLALGGDLEDAIRDKQKQAAPKLDLSDPSSLRVQLDRTAQSVLGRRATKSEKQAFVAIIHRMQRQQQAAESGETIELRSIEGPAEEFLAAEAPEEFAGNAAADGYGALLGMLGAGGLGFGG